MLDMSPDGMAREIEAARKFRRLHTQKTAEIELRLASNWYRTDWQGDPTPENSVFAYVAHMLPELAYANPAARVRPKRALTHKDVGDAVEMGLKSWMLDSHFTIENQLVVRDFLIGWGIMMVGMEDADYGNRPARLDGFAAMRPFAQHIPRNQFLMDPLCGKPQDARFMGHSYKIDLGELQTNARMDPAAVATLTAGADPGAGDENAGAEKISKDPETGDRQQVECIDIWFRETNQIATMAFHGERPGVFVRPPAPYQGPRDGPYEVYGAYAVPNDPYPCGPLQPAMEQIEETQQHVTAVANEAATAKNITLVEAGANDVLHAVKEGVNGGVYPVKGLANNVVQLPIGQIHPQRMQHIQNLRDRTERVLGLGQNQQGRTTNSTATEAATVQQNVDLRTEYLRARVEYSTHNVLRKIGHYLFYSPLVVMPVEQFDGLSNQTREGTFFGGQQQGQEQIEWEDFYLEVVPQSMSRADDEQLRERWLEVVQLAPQIAQYMSSMPFVNWRYIFDSWGETWNQKRLADVIFNPVALAAFAQDPKLFGMGVPLAAGAGAGPAGAGNPLQQMLGGGRPGGAGGFAGGGGGFRGSSAGAGAPPGASMLPTVQPSMAA